MTSSIDEFVVRASVEVGEKFARATSVQRMGYLQQAVVRMCALSFMNGAFSRRQQLSIRTALRLISEVPVSGRRERGRIKASAESIRALREEMAQIDAQCGADSLSNTASDGLALVKCCLDYMYSGHVNAIHLVSRLLFEVSSGPIMSRYCTQIDGIERILFEFVELEKRRQLAWFSTESVDA